ncbi:sulfite exporter TauE/SafE family protein [Pararhodobacter zhoushanensis]|uniref:Probable membrane transporter protein n=1 Tax=Pararhodobacter zhoushanensis TaxID=2479545 RepID=A0ABT3GVL5_9RHOB|nr:sulfite exporter TauE/SafE family protein [Pararhodobacter zhoushanensis]MCW1931572.1 sulfite exporter TauE/SafE family protein [Pararhodobacter zhoushanensis]
MAAVVFIAAFVRGFSGFGYPVLLVAAGALVTNPVPLVPVGLLGDMLIGVTLWRSARPYVDWPTMIRLIIGAAVGLVPGIWLLGLIDDDMARLVVSGMVLLAALVMLGGWTLPGRAGPSMTIGAGFVSGLVTPAGVAGPPVVTLAAALGLAPLVFRATLLAYFITLNVLAMGQFGLAGRLDRETVIAAALSVPLVLLGSWWGARRAVGANPARFRTLTIGVLMAMAVIGLGRALL